MNKHENKKQKIRSKSGHWSFQQQMILIEGERITHVNPIFCIFLCMHDENRNLYFMFRAQLLA